MVRPVIGALALALALAGCGGDPKTDPTPAPSTPVTTPVSTTPAPPVMPDEAKANTKAGAIAFVKYYIELVNRAQETGDLEALKQAEAVDCRSCDSARAAIRDIYASGGHIEGGALSASNESAAQRPDLNAWSVFADVASAAQTVVRPGKSETHHGGRTIITFVVRQDSSEWRVLEWTRSS